MDASGEPDTAGAELERWLEAVCARLRVHAADVEIQRPPVGNDGHAILVWKRGHLVAQGLLVRTLFNCAVATGVILDDLV